MADPTSAGHLYSSVTQLAYSESQTAIHPRPPFSIADRPGLVSQATGVAECAARFRTKDSNPMNQQALFSAQAKVNAAQTMFSAISNQVFNSLVKQDVIAAVTTAVQEVDAL